MWVSYFYKRVVVVVLMAAFFNSTYAQGVQTADTLLSKIEQLKKTGDQDQVLQLIKQHEDRVALAEKWELFTKLQLAKAQIFRNSNDYPRAEKILTDLEGKIANRLAANAKLLAGVYKTLGELYVDDMLLYEKGFSYYAKCLAIEGQLGKASNPDYIIALNNMAMTRKALGEFDKALRLHNQALDLVADSEYKKLHSNTLYYLGDLKLRLLAYDAAETFFEKALAVWEASDLPKIDAQVADYYKGLGWVYSGQGDFDKAIEFEGKALATYEKIKPQPDMKIGTIHVDMSYEYEMKKDYDQALQHAHRGLSIYQRIYGRDHPRLAYVHHSLGRIYRNQSQYFDIDRVDKSIEHYNENLRIDSVNYPQLNTPAVAVDYHGMGLAYKLAGEYRKALHNILTTFNIQKELFGKRSLRLINTMNNVGAVYVDLEDYDSARYYFNLALSICNEQAKEPTLDLINIHKNFADVYLREERYEKAKRSAEKSLSYFSIVPDAHYKIVLPPLDTLSFKQHLIYVLPRRSEALVGLYKQTKAPEYLELALDNDLHLAKVYIDIIQESNPGNGQLLQVSSLVATYENVIYCHSELMKLTGDPHHKAVAFNLAEKSKAVLLMKAIKENQSKQSLAIAPSVLQREDSLRQQMNELVTQLALMDVSADRKMSDAQSLAQQNLLKVRDEYGQLQKRLKKEFPAYNMSPLGFSAEAESVQKALQEDEALLEYVVGKEHIYGFLVTQHEINMQVLPHVDTLRHWGQIFRKAILSRDIQSFAARGQALYAKLLAPFEQVLVNENIDHINIVADGFLSYIPFEALPRAIPETLDYKSFDYVIKQYCINYNYSASLKLEFTGNTGAGKQNALAFAPTFDGPSKNLALRNAEVLTALPFAQKEAQDVVDKLDGIRFVGAEATETAFKQMAGGYEILHLATHALTDDSQPNRSHLYFAEDDSLNDGRLHAYELYNMKLGANLVTLSACNTGTGKFYRGEGIASLARAFRYAGCKNVIMSLWAVADESTSEIMNGFYDHASQGLKMAEALQQAKLDYLTQADGNTADPFYWAGFTLIGQNDPIQQQAGLSGVLITIVSLITLFGLIAVVTQRSFFSSK